MEVKTPDEIEIMREAGRITGQVLRELGKAVGPGITTFELDRIAEDLTLKKGARPAFKGYRNFPCSLCASINEEVVHGIPSKKRRLKEGDIIGLDFGVVFRGYYGDAAVTVPVGQVSEQARALIEATRASLMLGIDQARPGNRLFDIGAAVQEHVESKGFNVVRDFVGHGIGRALHEEPQVPNYGKRGQGRRLQPGMVLAIEPMVNAGGLEVEVLGDDWTAVTVDRSLSAHFEHTVALTEQGPEILTRMEGE